MLCGGKCLSGLQQTAMAARRWDFWHSYATPPHPPLRRGREAAAVIATAAVTAHFLLLRYVSGLEGRRQWEGFLFQLRHFASRKQVECHQSRPLQ